MRENLSGKGELKSGITLSCFDWYLETFIKNWPYIVCKKWNCVKQFPFLRGLLLQLQKKCGNNVFETKHWSWVLIHLLENITITTCESLLKKTDTKSSMYYSIIIMLPKLISRGHKYEFYWLMRVKWQFLKPMYHWHREKSRLECVACKWTICVSIIEGKM